MYLSGVERQKLLLSTLCSLAASLALSVPAVQFMPGRDICHSVLAERTDKESGCMNGRRQGHTEEQEERRTQGEGH